MINLIFDATAFSNLSRCPRLYDNVINRALAKPGGKSNSLEAGTLVHGILENYYRARIENLDLDTAIQIGFDAGEQLMKDLPNIPERSDKYNTGKIEIFDTMHKYFNYWRYADSTEVPIATEEVRGIMAYEDNNMRVIWKAKLDLILETEIGQIPRDTKTMKQSRDVQSLNYQFMGQCLVTGTRTMVVNKIGFQKTLPDSEKFLRVPVSYSSDRLAEFQNEIIPHYARMAIAYHESGYYPPNFEQCESKFGLCQFADVCGTDTNLRENILGNPEFWIVGEKWDV